MKTVGSKDYSDFGIEIPPGRTTGEVYTRCPECSEDRKKKKIKCLGVNLDLGIWHCNHCDWRGSINQKTYAAPPAWENKTQLSDKLVTWFQSRNIKQETLLEMRIGEGIEYMPQVEAKRNTVQFNYFEGEKLVNIKYRDGEKNFKMFKDAKLIFYNINSLVGQKEAYIVEGEMDALTMIQEGFKNTVSTPNGASKKNNNLTYLDNCHQYFEDIETVYIATDDDDPGNALADELARRIGVEKCKRIKFGEYKDANGAYSNGVNLKEYIKTNAAPYPIEGVKTVSDHWQALLDIVKNGHKPGWRPRGQTGKQIEFHPGYLTIVTGIPGHGKSEEVDQILMEISVDYDLRGAYFSPENSPTELHIIKLVEKIGGKNIQKYKELELRKIYDFLNNRVFWVYPEEGYSIDIILEKIRQAVKMYGINWFVIDPWNKLEHLYNESETKYISETLDKIINFCKRNGVHCFLVAHPTKMKVNPKTEKYDIPGLYDISGSSHFYNKADIGLTIYKEKTSLPGYPDEYKNSLHIQKVKFKHWGYIGMVELTWNKENGRFDQGGTDLTNWLEKPTQQTTLPLERSGVNMNSIGRSMAEEREKQNTGKIVPMYPDEPQEFKATGSGYYGGVPDSDEVPF